jgi:hypothetical protein
MTKRENVFALFDAYNEKDPRKIEWEGISYAVEHFYALQLYNWVIKLKPDAQEPLLIASRCQHIGRWQITRSQYPKGKVGYFTWRHTLAKFHAETAGALLAEGGYDAVTIKLVQRILLKEQLIKNGDVQVMEDALCLVFLEFQYENFLSTHDEDMILKILKTSWNKMDESGREAALKLTYSEKGKALLEKALDLNKA